MIWKSCFRHDCDHECRPNQWDVLQLWCCLRQNSSDPNDVMHYQLCYIMFMYKAEGVAVLTLKGWRSRWCISDSSPMSVSFLWNVCTYETKEKNTLWINIQSHFGNDVMCKGPVVLRFALHCMLLLSDLFVSYHCAGQIWRSDAELLGAVWRPRWLRGCCHGFTPLASSHRPAPSGGDGDPLHSQPAGSHVSGRGTHQSSPHPDVPACTHQGSIAAGCSRGTLLAWKPTHALLYWEEDFTGEPGNRSNWECFQRHGKRCSEADKAKNNTMNIILFTEHRTYYIFFLKK